jgi:hypothetical protein
MQPAVIPVGSSRGRQGHVGVGWWVNRHTETAAVVGGSPHSCYLRCEGSQLGVAGVSLGSDFGSKIDGTVRVPAVAGGRVLLSFAFRVPFRLLVAGVPFGWWLVGSFG